MTRHDAPESKRASIDPPAAVVGIARKLEDAGFETWCVGGAVRDALLGKQHLDWDFATAARPEQVRKIFRRTVPVGIEFGTIGVLDEANVMHEVTTFRRDVQTDGRHAVVEFGASFDEDLARRDFTINAIAYSPTRAVLHDPFRGERDLRARVVRAVGDPGDRMREDRLRALRAIRFAARYGFEIEPRTWAAIVESAPHMSRLSPERVRQEMEKTMDQVPCPSGAFARWRDGGAFGTLIPDLSGVTDLQLRAIDHLRRPILATRPQRRLLRIAALLSAVPAGRAANVMKSLRFSNAAGGWISSLIEALARLEPVMRTSLESPAGAADADIRRWVSVAGRTRFASVVRLADAIWWAEREAGLPAPAAAKIASLHRRALRIAYRDPVELGDLAVDGTDLQKLGIAGPALGKALHALLEAVVRDPSLNTPDRLLSLAKNGSPTRPDA
ncbi:MAG TPA: CCA tRNA nucleotidyltransferase [Gemmatimonadaceae bacterium]|nr:CCA tRNA nucleotidyltransferase [Gemmatimonadaceae bacterium]